MGWNSPVHLPSGGDAGAGVRAQGGGTAPLSINASSANCSWRSPAVRTAVIGLPPPSARGYVQLGREPALAALERLAHAIDRRLTPDGARPAYPGGVLVDAHHRRIHEVHVPVEIPEGKRRARNRHAFNSEVVQPAILADLPGSTTMIRPRPSLNLGGPAQAEARRAVRASPARQGAIQP